LFSTDVVAVVVGARRRMRPGLTPPPAIHMVKAFGVVVAAVGALRRRRPAELAAPEHERILEQAARLRGRASRPAMGTSTSAAFWAWSRFRSLVLVPLVGVRDLDEPHARFREAAGHEALAAEVLRNGVIEAVELFGGLGFVAEVLQFGGFGLHAEGEFKGLDAAFEGAVRTGRAASCWRLSFCE
jgi:hypothetical protein